MREALRARRGQPTERCDALELLLDHLIELEADDDNVAVLRHHDADARVEGESLGEREMRAADVMNVIRLWFWADDSPMLKLTLQFHLWGILFDGWSMRNAEAAWQFCSEPQVEVVTPGNASADFLAWVQDHRTQDTVALGKDGFTLKDGTRMRVQFRMIKADGPMLAMLANTHASGGSHHKSVLSGAHAHNAADLRATLGVPLRTLEDIHAFATKCAAVDGFAHKIDMRKARAGQIRKLLDAIDPNPPPARTLKPALERRAIGLVQGVNGKPLALGGLAPSQVEGASMLELFYDVCLHGCTGQLKALRAHLKTRLSADDKDAFVAWERRVVGDKDAWSGADVRLWAAAFGCEAAEEGLDINSNLAGAVTCMAQASRWGFRLPYCEWQALRGLAVMRFASLIYLTAEHILAEVPVVKASKSKRGQAKILEDLYQTYWSYIAHAAEDLQYMPIISSECERCEQNFRPSRTIGKECSSKKVQNLVQNLVSRLQMEPLVKEEHGAANSGTSKTLQEWYATSFPEGADAKRMRFGKRYWQSDANWGWLVRVLAAYATTVRAV